MAHTVLSTTRALVRSVAVHSMNTLRVRSEMALRAPLITGGSDSTLRSASRMTG